MKTLRQVALAAAALTFASASHAGFIVLDSGAPATVTTEVAATNDFHDALAGIGINDYSTGLSLGTDVFGTISFYYYGKEAGYRNDFYAQGASSFTYSTGYDGYHDYFGAPISIGSITVGPGILNFGFCSYDEGSVYVPGAAPTGCVYNYENDALSMTSLQSIAMHVTDSEAWLFWDDGGAGPDDNHDDMLIRAVFTPTQVPEPATGALLGVAMLGLGLARRKQTKQAR